MTLRKGTRILIPLTHWGQVTHRCVSKLATIGLHGAQPLSEPMLKYSKLDTYLGTNLIEIYIISFFLNHFKNVSGKWRPVCLGLNVLIADRVTCLVEFVFSNVLPLYGEALSGMRGLEKTMMTSSNGNFSTLLALFAGNSPVTGEFPSQRPVTQFFFIFSLVCAYTNGWIETPVIWDVIALIMTSL